MKLPVRKTFGLFYLPSFLLISCLDKWQKWIDARVNGQKCLTIWSFRDRTWVHVQLSKTRYPAGVSLRVTEWKENFSVPYITGNLKKPHGSISTIVRLSKSSHFHPHKRQTIVKRQEIMQAQNTCEYITETHIYNKKY